MFYHFDVFFHASCPIQRFRNVLKHMKEEKVSIHQSDKLTATQILLDSVEPDVVINTHLQNIHDTLLCHIDRNLLKFCIFCTLQNWRVQNCLQPQVTLHAVRR